jgi:hypothetical protein
MSIDIDRVISRNGRDAAVTEFPAAMVPKLDIVAAIHFYGGRGCKCIAATYEAARTEPRHGIRIVGDFTRRYWICTPCLSMLENWSVEMAKSAKENAWKDQVSTSLKDIALCLKYIVAHLDKQELSTLTISREERKA